MKKYIFTLLIMVIFVTVGVYFLYNSSKSYAVCDKLDDLSYSIIFNTMGGKRIDDIKTCYGCDEFEDHNIVAAERSNVVSASMEYSFAGWYFDSKYKNEVKASKISELKPIENLDSNKCVTNYNDIILYAKWVPKHFTIAFDTKGGERLDSIIATYNEAIELPVPTREGYVFDYWKTKDGSVVKSGDKLESENITVYAVWKSK